MRRRTDDEDEMGRRIGDFDDPYLNRKRRRRGEYGAGGGGPGGGGYGHHPALTSEALEYVSEWHRQSAVMNEIGDPSTAEAMIARNAFDRLDELGRELDLPGHVIDLAHQVNKVFFCI